MSSTTPLGQRQNDWLPALFLHCVFAVIGSMAFGFFPEATLERYWYNTNLEPYSPMIALIALFLGYFIVSSGLSGRAATSTWVVGLLWLTVGIYDAGSGWSPKWSSEKTRFAYVLANLFTSRCDECLGELIFTTPFTACVMYSIGAYIKKRRLAARLGVSDAASVQ